MDRRAFLNWTKLAGLSVRLPIGFCSTALAEKTPSPPAGNKAAPPETILLKDYRPRSIYKIPITAIPKAKYPVLNDTILKQLYHDNATRLLARPKA